MPLIVAIEPDGKQAARLTALGRGPLKQCELVIVDSVSRAVAEMDLRAPDLVLTPLLLSPKDDAALAAKLREIGAGEQSFPTLVIPVMAAPPRGVIVDAPILKRL